jgi:hypothetical protein
VDPISAAKWVFEHGGWLAGVGFLIGAAVCYWQSGIVVDAHNPICGNTIDPTCDAIQNFKPLCERLGVAFVGGVFGGCCGVLVNQLTGWGNE